ncbi:hypothetical protein KO506_03890 [Polaribacter vadi]|uniref:hypothetical protein n=1 Tax=Polaribacter TaxID=52959 RepID=UPI001C0992F0|nr:MULTISPECIES: hypothetical protein [Polaribacter]MBU3010530.1 hypothetical protein [Polaribacter vadi]MDO6740340.1 hypothetical protein [Polaribacter sp. 1_MG-2023]
MKQTIKSLYEDINIHAIPDNIKEYFYQLTFLNRELCEIKPFSSSHSYDNIEFYLLERNHIELKRYLKQKKIIDETNTILDIETIAPYLVEYGKGFHKGYSEYESTLKTDKSLFTISNKETAYQIFSKIHSFTPEHNRGQLPSLYIANMDEMLDFENDYKGKVLFTATLKDYFFLGKDGGEFYRAWQIILQNPTIFEDIFNKHFQKSEPKEEKQIEIPDLSIKDIPKFNLLQRFYLFKLLGVETSIHQLKTDIQGSKYKVLASIMGISPDNAKKLIGNSYKKGITEKDKAEVKDFLYRNKIEL